MLEQIAPHPKHAGGEETRTQLINAATEVFLEDGFRAARVADIAKRANLRLSAINYHFGSKEGLYLAVLRHHAELAIHQIPLAIQNPDSPLKERLGFAIHALLERMLSPDSASRIGPLMLRELVNPTAALETLFERFSLPQAQIVMDLAREVVGPAVPDEMLKRGGISIFGQSMAYVLARPLLMRIAPEVYEGKDFLDRTAAHILNFSWAGLLAIRAQWEDNK